MANIIESMVNGTEALEIKHDEIKTHIIALQTHLRDRHSAPLLRDSVDRVGCVRAQ